MKKENVVAKLINVLKMISLKKKGVTITSINPPKDCGEKEITLPRSESCL